MTLNWLFVTVIWLHSQISVSSQSLTAGQLSLTFFWLESQKKSHNLDHMTKQKTSEKTYIYYQKNICPCSHHLRKQRAAILREYKNQAAVLCSLGVALRFALKKISVPGAELPKRDLPCWLCPRARLETAVATGAPAGLPWWCLQSAISEVTMNVVLYLPFLYRVPLCPMLWASTHSRSSSRVSFSRRKPSSPEPCV